MSEIENVEKVTVNFRCPIRLRDNFQKLYPYCITRFIVNALKMALKNRSFFDSVFFYVED